MIGYAANKYFVCINSCSKTRSYNLTSNFGYKNKLLAFPVICYHKFFKLRIVSILISLTLMKPVFRQALIERSIEEEEQAARFLLEVLFTDKLLGCL